MAQRLTTFTSLWDLIEQRAADTPGRPLRHRRGRPHAHVRGVPRRVASGPRPRSTRAGIGEGDVVSWQLPTWIEAMVLVGGLARLGAVQNPILPIYREREVGFVVREAGAKLLVVAGRVARLRLRRDGAWPRASTAEVMEVHRGDTLDGDVGALPPGAGGRRAVRARRPARRSAALALLHVGHDRRPEGRAPHRQHRRRRRRGRWSTRSTSPPTTATRSSSRSPTSAASAG